MGFGSLLLELSQLVIVLRLITSGDVELNPGPLDGEQLFSCIWEGLACETQCVYLLKSSHFRTIFDISSSSDQKEIDKVLSTVDNTTFGT